MRLRAAPSEPAAISENVVSAAHEGWLIPIRTWASGGGKADATYETSGASSRTLLMLAAANGEEIVADLLLKRGAQVGLQDSNGTTALLEAAQMGHVQVMDMRRSQPSKQRRRDRADGCHSPPKDRSPASPDVGNLEQS